MSIEMKLELGHRAALRKEPTVEGFTHDWLVFVKGAEGTDINHFVEKVVFHLHESFHKPRRIAREPPYQVEESGYAGFMMPIEVYFRSKEEPKKVRFEYDLFLRLEGSPVYNIRREKLTFQNPSEDFRRKLLIARGVGPGTTVSNNAPSLPTQEKTSAPPIEESSRSSYPHAKQTPAPEKKIKSHSTTKESTKKGNSSGSGSKESQKFADTFGSSPNANAHRSRKTKESHSSQSKSSKSLPPPPPSEPATNATPKEPKSASKTSHSPEIKEPKSKPAKPEKEPKSATKRSHPPEPQNHHGSSEKKRRHHSSSDTSEKHTDSNKIKETKEKKEKHKSKVSGHSSKKEKHKTSHSHSSNKEHSTKYPSKSVNNVKPSPSSRLSNDDDDDDDDNSRDAKTFTKQDKGDSSPASDLVNATDTWCEASPEKVDSTVDKNMISPMSPDTKHSPVHIPEKLKQNSNHILEDSLDEKPRKLMKIEKSPKPKSAQKPKKPSTPVNDCSSNNVHNNVRQNGTLREHAIPTPNKITKSDKENKENPDHTYIRGLMDLQQRIMALEDRNLLQNVVDVIQETGCYQMTSSSFDFDLCSLDPSIVHKLKQCLSSDKNL